MKHLSKVMIFLALLTILPVCMTGCAGNNREEKPDAPIISTEPSASSTQPPEEVVTEENKPEATKPEVPAKPTAAKGKTYYYKVIAVSQNAFSAYSNAVKVKSK